MSIGTSSLVSELKEYFRLRLEYYKLETGEQFDQRFSGGMASMLNKIIVAILFICFYFFFMVFLGFAIAEIYGPGESKYFVGFGAVFLFQLLLLLWFQYFGKNFIRKKISEKIATMLLEQSEKEEVENE